jgi:hypothetical protein
MKNRFLLFGLLCGVVLFSCKKENKIEDPDTNQPVSYDSLDLGISFNRYVNDSTYATDTIQTEFKITNYSAVTISSGSVIKTACKLGGVTFALDLIGQGPTDLVLPNDLPQGGVFVYNPGYLLGQSLLDYFATDTVEIAVMVYGVNDVIISPTFEGDPFPENNLDALNFFAGGLRLKP